MIKFFKKIYRFFHRFSFLIIRIWLFLVVGILLVYQFPRIPKFKYEFAEGAPWMHSDLIAAYDFPVSKLPQEIQKEKDSLMENFFPYYVLSDSVFDAVKKNFSEDFDSLKIKYSFTRVQYKSLHQYKDSLLGIFQSIYNQGIIKNEIRITSKQKINLLIKNVAYKKNVSDFFTQEKAFLKFKENFYSKLQNCEHQKIIDFYQSFRYEKYIKSNVLYDAAKTEQIYQALLQSISPTQGYVQKGEAIILKGQIITHEKYKKLLSYKKLYEKGTEQNYNNIFIVLGQSIIVGFILLLLFFFVYRFRTEIYKNFKAIVFILLLLFIEVSLTNLFVRSSFLNVYILPYVLFPLLIKSFFDARSAIFYHTVSVLLSAYLVANSYEFILLQYFSGFLAVLALENMSKRSQIFRISIVVFLSYSLVYLAFNGIHNTDIIQFVNEYLVYFAVSSLLLLLSYPLIYMFEKLFGFISDISLLELSDTNHELLRKMAENAPGTFQHSLQVANLAEDAVRKIRGSALLVRVGALYHDIGKLYAPEYFTENQLGNYNPHEKLTCEESAQAIIKHITKGVKMAEKAGLPEQIIDFIRTHHGTTRTEYFYRTFKNKFPGKEVNEAAYTYPGPVPFSKETAVLMMADSVEAASRSLKEYSPQNINNLVDKIIDSQLNRGQFQNAPISFKQISTIKSAFKEKLANIYHSRIAYPEEKK